MSRKFSKWWAGMAGMAWDHGLHATSSIERATVELREICLRVCVSQGPALGADNRLITKSPHEMRKTPPLNETYAPSPSPPPSILSSPLSHSLCFPLLPAARHSAKQKSCKRESDVEEEKGSLEFMKR